MKSTLKTGLITGLIICGVFLAGFLVLMKCLSTHYWNMPADTIRGIVGLLSIPIQFIGIYIAMQNAKKASGTLTYGQALKTGVIVAITIAIVVSVFSFLYCTFNPHYAADMVQDAQKFMRAAHETEQQISTDSVKVAAEFTTGMQVTEALVGQFVMGTIMSLILGLFLKGKKKS